MTREQHRYVREVYLPLRDGQTGHFLGIYRGNRRVGSCFQGDRFTGPQIVRGMPNGARFRNTTVGVTFEFHTLWLPVAVAEPNGCRYCDFPQRGHSNWGYTTGIGLHAWTEPTDQQRLHRMQWRRYFSPRGRGFTRPVPIPVLPTLTRSEAPS